MSLIAIDPGACSGWALFGTSGALVACGARDVVAQGLPTIKARDARVIVEHPFVYPAGRTRDPNAIVKLGVNAGRWAALLELTTGSRAEFIYPRQWKGTIDADTVCKRTYARLTPTERGLVDALRLPKSKVHNVLDAIGLGIWALGDKRAGAV